MSNNNRKVGEKIKQEARNDIRKDNAFRNKRINVGERITDSGVQEEKEINKTIKRGMKETELTEVLGRCIN